MDLADTVRIKNGLMSFREFLTSGTLDLMWPIECRQFPKFVKCMHYF